MTIPSCARQGVALRPARLAELQGASCAGTQRSTQGGARRCSRGIPEALGGERVHQRAQEAGGRIASVRQNSCWAEGHADASFSAALKTV
jgi:hypothetical protein